MCRGADLPLDGDAVQLGELDGGFVNAALGAPSALVLSSGHVPPVPDGNIMPDNLRPVKHTPKCQQLTQIAWSVPVLVARQEGASWDAWSSSLG